LKFKLAATSSITSSALTNFFPQITTLRAPKMWRSEKTRSRLYGEWGKTVPQIYVIASCVFELGC
jgi:hypothetical protein